MKVELNIRNRVWRKGVVAMALMLAFMVAMLTVGLGGRDWLLFGVALLTIPILAFVLYSFLWPGKWNCMRLVKGEMRYRELKDAIAPEDLEAALAGGRDNAPCILRGVAGGGRRRGIRRRCTQRKNALCTVCASTRSSPMRVIRTSLSAELCLMLQYEKLATNAKISYWRMPWSTI